jgi:chemotaxis protein methyltransferase CheR
MASDDSTEAIEMGLVLEAIHAKYGYDFRGYTPDSMARRVRAALARSGLAHLGELQHRLLTEPEFFASMLTDLTVQVSGMFRDPGFYRAFREHVVPVLRTYPQIKIWHAGCACGEEVYTTAILLFEEGLHDRTQIYATDVSQTAVEQAREGVYPDSRLPSFASNYAESGGKRDFEDYYTPGYGSIAVREGLRKNLVFFQHNLVTDYALGEMHVILCRNVFIYFGLPLRERVQEMFERGLCRGGFLCLGDSESLPRTTGTLREFLPAQRIYRLERAA